MELCAMETGGVLDDVRERLAKFVQALADGGSPRDVSEVASSTDETAREVSPVRAEVSIDLSGHTLHFTNYFPDSTFLGIRFSGLCGGMAYTVLDLFHAGLQAPARIDVPTMSDPLGRYIYGRQVDTLLGLHGVRFLAMLLNPYDTSVARLSDASFEELRGHLDRGVPMPLGLIPAPWTIDVTRFTEAHQVVARGYRVDADGTRNVDVWDPNRPEDAHTWIVNRPGEPSWREEAAGHTWRGFFVEDGYASKIPPEDAVPRARDERLKKEEGIAGESPRASTGREIEDEPGGEAAGPSRQTTSQLQDELPLLRAMNARIDAARGADDLDVAPDVAPEGVGGMLPLRAGTRWDDRARRTPIERRFARLYERRPDLFARFLAERSEDLGDPGFIERVLAEKRAIREERRATEIEDPFVGEKPLIGAFDVVPWIVGEVITEVGAAFDAGGLIANAVASAGHSDTLKELSPMAGALASSVDAGLGTALGLGTSLSAAGAEVAQEVASTLASSVGESVAGIIGNIVEVVPIVGAFVKAAITLFTLGMQGPPPGETASQECQQLFTNLPPQKSGSMLAGGETVPADFFASVNPLAMFWLGHSARKSDLDALQKEIAARFLGFYAHVGFFAGSSFDDLIRPLATSKLVDQAMPPTVPFYPAGPLKCRSAIGMALMQVTEGMAADLDDFDWNHVLSAVRSIDEENRKGSGKEQFKSAKDVRSMWERSIERDMNILVRTWKKNHPKDTKVGLPKAWRDRFRTLRRGIEASYWPNSKTTTDGGVALWITYVDLVQQAYAKGYFNDAFVEWIFARQFGSFPMWMPGAGDAFFHPEDSKHAIVFKNLWFLVNERLLHAAPDENYVNQGLTAAPPTWIWFKDPCPRMAAYQIGQLSKSWGNTTHPHYTMGKEKLTEIMAKTKAAAMEHGKKMHAARHPSPVPHTEKG